ncbi:MAG: 30S ribosomal protein S16 [bacterium]
MLSIRLFRGGKKKQPYFKVVVTDSRNAPRAGRFVEQVGFLNPLTKEKSLKAERIKHWMSVGAKPSVTVYNMLVAEKIVDGGKLANHAKSKKAAPSEEKKEEEKTVAPKPVEEGKAKEKTVAPEPAAESPKEEKEEERTIVPESVEPKEAV